MDKDNLFVGRESELKRLINLTKKKTASLIVVKGRRRVGKSRLIDEFSKNFSHYYKFEGLAPDKGITIAHQLDEFSKQISENFHAPKAKYSDWSDAFSAVGERVKNGKILLFFDELSWMEGDDPTFLSKIKIFWDNQLKKNNKLIFVICSSASAWIEKNLLSSTGFVGRVSLELKLEELPLADCNKFWSNNISPYEKFKILAVTGGIPKYLEEINPKETAEENIKQLCFTDGGLLVKEFDRIFSNLFLRKSPFYKKIVNVLASGPKQISEIQLEICKGKDVSIHGRIPEYLWELEESGFIKRDYIWDFNTGNDLKLSKYRLQDNYLRFYLKYIKKYLTKIERGSFALKSLYSLPEWNTIMGFQFENLVLNNRKIIHTILNITPNDIISENPYFQTKTNRTSGCQIDYLIQTKFGSLYVCEIKFSKNQIDNSVIQETQNKIINLKHPKGFSIRPVLIHVNGVTNDLIEKDYFYQIIDMSELLCAI